MMISPALMSGLGSGLGSELGVLGCLPCVHDEEVCGDRVLVIPRTDVHGGVPCHTCE